MLVVLEGLDGAGKSTQVKKLRTYLEEVFGYSMVDGVVEETEYTGLVEAVGTNTSFVTIDQFLQSMRPSQLQREAVQLNELLNRVLEALDPEIAARGIGIAIPHQERWYQTQR